MKVGATETAAMSQVVSSSAAKVTQSENSKDTLQNAVKQLAEDFYQKEDAQDASPIYSRPMNIVSDSHKLTKSVEDTLNGYMKELSLATAHLYLPGGNVPKSVEKMFNQYSTIASELVGEQPSLLDKNWGISINQSGELEVSGTLTGDEKTFLEAKLNGNEEFVAAANDFKSNYLKYIDAEYKGWARYDVNADNFSEVFDLKEMVENSQGDEVFQKTWGKDFSWLELNDNISSQLRRHAPKN
ncbi:hypothetical protein [Idiomarina aminovorans]|uniref:hypothetical protein n=1 Tax=Idiomarina aminovorans TaxID=2914829 RepID=UPI002003B01D|nr:hypothetical protein [Idiomarina sp. ATCH4]MCK7458833.1 hypothetical protein [Idiomarina sp. ATCH4]